jgi:putative nucleotidyltransferase with HDIG domain
VIENDITRHIAAAADFQRWSRVETKFQLCSPINRVFLTDKKMMDTNDGGMIAIPIQDFIASSKLQVDIFVRLQSGRFVQVAKSGEVVSVDRLKNYETKKVDHLYIRKDDYKSYVDTNLEIAGITLTRQDLDGRAKGSFVAQVANAVSQEIEALGVNEETYVHARMISRVAIDLVETKVNFRTILDALNTSSNETFAHSIGVSITSVMLGHALGWTQQTTQEKLALGGLFHDIGMKDLPKELMSKAASEMTHEERQLYELHPAKGVEILKTIEGVPEDVLAIVFEHHENAIGHGFPRRLKTLRIHPLARVIGLADLFCELTIKSPSTQELRPIADAFQFIEKTYGQLYPRDMMSALSTTVTGGKGSKKAA